MTHRDKTEDMDIAERAGYADGFAGSRTSCWTATVKTANELWAYDLGKRLGWHMSRVR